MIKISINKSFLLVFAASAAAALLIGGTLPYYVFYFLAFIFVISYFYISIQKYTIDAKVAVDDKVHTTGDLMECLTMVKCGFIIPTAFALVKSESYLASAYGYEGELVNLTIEEDKWVRHDIKFHHRGIYDLGTVHVTVLDFFQIFTLNKVIDTDVRVKVYPKIYPINSLTIGGKDIYQEVLDIRSTNEDVFTIKDVRKYHLGDSLRKVHWKVSAKHGELFVKNSDSIAGEEFTIFLSLHSSNLLLDKEGVLEELNVDLCASLVSYMQERGICTKVYLNCKTPAAFDIESKDKFNTFLEFLLTQKSDGEENFGEFIYNNFYKLQRNTKLAIITGTIDERLCSNISKIREYGYEAVVFYLSEASDIKDSIAYLKTIGTECFNTIEFTNKLNERYKYEYN
jgi:hypothetical protein